MNAKKSKYGETVVNLITLEPRKNLDRLCYSNTKTFDHPNQSALKPFNDLISSDGYTSELMFITSMKVVVREGWIKGLDVVAGLEMTYNNGKTIFHGGKEPSWKTYDFKVGFGEKIIKVVMRFGYVVDSLEFHSNMGHKWGPYGGRGGYECKEIICQPQISKGFLGTISGSVVKSQGYDLIRYVSFVWGCLNSDA